MDGRVTHLKATLNIGKRKEENILRIFIVIIIIIHITVIVAERQIWNDTNLLFLVRANSRKTNLRRDEEDLYNSTEGTRFSVSAVSEFC